MSPTEIKIELLKKGVKQVDIARQCDAKPPSVSQVIHGHAVSARLRQAIADAIGRCPSEIWPQENITQTT